jgi:hypothetical protein
MGIIGKRVRGRAQGKKSVKESSLYHQELKHEDTEEKYKSP